jgi:uncharacterized protein YgiM (DUF1202 family)
VLGKVRDFAAIGLGALALLGFAAFPAAAQEAESAISPPLRAADVEPCPPKVRCVKVADPFLEMHTGAGVGYPVFHVVERGEAIQVLTRRTSWFYVRTSRQVEGWVHREQMMTTLELDGEPTEIREPTREDYTARRWEAGAFMGRYGGASLVALFGSYGFTEHLNAELTLANAVGNVSDSGIASLGLTHIFAPEWRASPYVGVGTGVIYTKTRATLVEPEDATDQIGYVGGGVRAYISRRFVGRFEYRRNVIFTSTDDNEELHEWKLGFAFFF